MKLRIISLSPTVEPPQFMGMLFIDRDEETEPQMIRVLAADTPPGYRLEYGDGTPANLIDPVAQEADRLVRVLLMPAEESARRHAEVRAVIHSGHLSGFADDPDWQAAMFRFARGEIDDAQLDAIAHATAKSQTPNVNVDPAAPPVTTSAEWWAAMRARFRQYVLDTTVTDTEAASMLGCTISDVATLVVSNQLLEQEQAEMVRIPKWQFLDPDRADQGGRWALLPGLELVIAATPPMWLNGTELTPFMTLPRTELTDGGEPLSAAEWLARGRNVAAVVSALRWVRWP